MTIEYRLENARTFDFAAADALSDRSIHQTAPWLSFVAATQGAEPVVASLSDGGRTVGYFTGLIVRKYGLKILGSPFAGWTTDYMGFSLLPGYPRSAALAGLREFAFKTLGCAHVEIYDRHATEEDARAGTYEYRVVRSFEIDLRRDEDALFGSMIPACRTSVRKAVKSGVVVEEACDAAFADDYYAQLLDVFAKQKLVPTYGVGRVRALIEHLLPTGNLLLLRARDKDGRCVATALFTAFKERMIYWGAASWRQHQHLRPNEAIVWHAMRHFKAKGVSFFDMGGGGEYKRRYGGYEIAVPWMRASRFAAVARLRNAAKRAVDLKQKFLGLAGQWRRE